MALKYDSIFLFLSFKLKILVLFCSMLISFKFPPAPFDPLKNLFEIFDLN